MKLSDKIINLRKTNGWSQEDLAERLNVSRQAISRWENGTALPDANNILQLSKLFSVTADYLLNEDASNIPSPQESIHRSNISKKTFWLIAAIAFSVSGVIWLILAINGLNIFYVLLAIVNAVLSAVNLFLYLRK